MILRNVFPFEISLNLCLYANTAFLCQGGMKISGKVIMIMMINNFFKVGRRSWWRHDKVKQAWSFNWKSNKNTSIYLRVLAKELVNLQNQSSIGYIVARQKCIVYFTHPVQRKKFYSLEGLKVANFHFYHAYFE